GMGSNVQLVWPKSEAYTSRVNNCSHANSSLATIRAKLSAEQLEQFKTSCFGHLLNIDKIQFSKQIGVKDLDGLSFLIGCDVAQFTRHDFCLITGLRFGKCLKFPVEKVIGFGKGQAFEHQCKLPDLFNMYPRGSVSFDKTQDSLFSAPTEYMKSFENEEGRGKGKSKVTGISRRNEKGKKDKHGEVQRGGWSFKGFTYAFQIWVYELIPRMADLKYCKVVDPTDVPLILQWRTTTSVPEIRKLNNYFFQSKEDRLAIVSTESIHSSCADLDELNKVVSLLRSKLFQVKREKDVLELKVIWMKKNLDNCLGPQFEQEVRRDLALLKERTNRCVMSHLFKGCKEVDDIERDEEPSNRNEGEEKE
ncbi:BURP domain-containing protein, partial [Prunus dulcis]